MNRPGKKKIYIDTWAVSFFNTGTQSREEAKEGVRGALETFKKIDLNAPISVLQFTELMALFARPEFDDIRRFKLLPFPSESSLRKFGEERSDARAFGDRYPEENLVVGNKAVDIGPVSYIFGQRIHYFGLISHSINDNTADGRIFTGPADFLEHDYAHAFFNLAEAIPGSIEEWQEVHREFIAMKDAESDPKMKRMMRLVYYHFTHESGFRVLLTGGPNELANTSAFENELNIIDELLHTRFHYDWILQNNFYPEGYRPYLEGAFFRVGFFFRDRFLKIQARALTCPANLSSIRAAMHREYGPQ